MWALGCHIVNELGGERDTDTLGRWMAHHLAELMVAAEEAATAEEHAAARSAVESAILRVWGPTGPWSAAICTRSRDTRTC